MLSVIFALSFALSVSADVIFEPEDDFYNAHRDECVYVDRQFVAGQDVASFNKPNGNFVECRFKQGDTINISYTYEDENGIIWGITDFSDSLGSEAKGWMPMGYLAVVYDNSSFLAEFDEQINKEPEEFKLPEADLLIFWEYPGANNYYDFEPWDDSYRDMSFMYSYTDPNGTEWGYVGYFYGMKGWVRTDDPSSTTAPEQLEREPEVLYPESVLDDDIAEKGGLSPIWLAVILVAAVCTVTAVLIVILTRKKKA